MKVVAVCVAVIFALYVGLSAFGAVKAMAIPRLPLEDSLDSVGLAYEDVTFTSRDDEVLLKGWYVPGDGSIWRQAKPKIRAQPAPINRER